MWSTLPPPFTLEQAALAVDPLAGTTDTHQPTTALANSPIPRLRRSPPAGQHHLQQRTKHKQQFLCKDAPAQEPKTGHPILLRNRHRGYKYEL